MRDAGCHRPRYGSAILREAPSKFNHSIFPRIILIVFAAVFSLTRLAANAGVTNSLQRIIGAQQLIQPWEEYLYSEFTQRRLQTLKTWQNFAGNSGTNTTTWVYDGYRGFLTNKLYGASAGPQYSYTAGGREATRLWARGVTTSYGYDNGGGLSSISYDDGTTPGVTRTADRRGRVKTLTQNSITTTLDYVCYSLFCGAGAGYTLRADGKRDFTSEIGTVRGGFGQIG